ncbi:MAG: outer membrane homotrimeric porin [Desulfovibrionaceae bacterium]|nr:outer membrane homotrimeric porin [Desulfovibrionaceae bacterium]
MKRLVTLLLAAGLVFSATTAAQAIDFKASGQWLMGFSAGDGNLVSKYGERGNKSKLNSNDKFTAAQRLRLKLEAVASENLSGTVQFEIGDTTWGQSGHSGALGADDTCIEVKHAYLDWAIPDTALKVRMGIQPILLPNAAGGSAVLDDDMAAVVASYEFNENVSATLMWGRPYNDNYGSNETVKHQNYLDNVDLIALSVPMSFDGFKVTPWIMYGMIGKNALLAKDSDRKYNGPDSLFALANPAYVNNLHLTKAYGSAFWGGLAAHITAADPLNIEFDFNYGYVENMGNYDAYKSDGTVRRGELRSEGFLLKALVEYKMDWGTPGIFGWYASGDDGDPTNGSERMPSVSACGNFTSFMGDGNLGWSSSDALYDRELSYAGTWGVGLQVKDMSFLENLTHTFRVAYWGGTNDPSAVKYFDESIGFLGNNKYGQTVPELYLTKTDSILEFNLVNNYKMYENFDINFELGYMVNFIDNDTWKHANTGRNDSFDKREAWKAQLIVAYQFYATPYS